MIVVPPTPMGTWDEQDWSQFLHNLAAHALGPEEQLAVLQLRAAFVAFIAGRFNAMLGSSCFPLVSSDYFLGWDWADNKRLWDDPLRRDIERGLIMESLFHEFADGARGREERDVAESLERTANFYGVRRWRSAVKLDLLDWLNHDSL